jgi:hemicentin
MELRLLGSWLLLATIVSVTYGGVTYEYPDVLPQGSASLAFVFDITGSMYDDLVQVIEGAAKILATTLARREKPLYNYVLVPFHDPEIGPVTVTTDPDQFQRDLRDLYVQGGGDCPEMSVGAIKASLEESLPNSFIYVFTDARAKDYYLVESVLTLIQQKQSQVVFVMTGDCGNTSHPGYKAYEQIASTSSGQIFLLKKKQVNQVLNFVRVAVQSQKVNLLSVDRERADSITYSIPIDTKLAEFTVSLSGSRPKLHLRDPDGRRLTRHDGYLELLSLKQALIINIKDPRPGIYKLRVTSEGPHTVRVTGLSELDFRYGFSRKNTLEFHFNQNRPMKGIPTYMLLNATNLEYPGRMNMLQLLSLSGETLLEIPLIYVDSRPTLYNVSAFIPPDLFFYPRIMGIDSKGYEFVRSTPTAISPEAPDIPIITMDAITKGFYDKVAILTCKVYSTVPYTVQWYREGEPTGNKLFFSESQDVAFSVPDASSFSESYYRCNATNAAGWAMGQTFLDVKDPPPAILKPQNVSVLPGNSIIMTCVAYSTVEFNLTWYRASDNYDLTELKRARVFTNGSVEIR